MPSTCDILLYLTPQMQITGIKWMNELLMQQLQPYWNTYTGYTLQDIPAFQIDSQNQQLIWKNKRFHFEKENLSQDLVLLFLFSENQQKDYYQAALDLLDESMQIYDVNGNVIYFNKTACKVAGLDESPEGENLLDIFDLTGDESTTMEVLREDMSIRNRFTHYYTRKGKELITVNSTFPIHLHGELIGALNLEENLSVIHKKSEQLDNLKKVMEEKASRQTFPASPSLYTLEDYIGHHPKVSALRELAYRIAPQDSNILIVGETGTGKEILAQGIHRASSRSAHNFVAVNCAAFPENLIESMLFGTQKGSFTGSSDKVGLLENAHQGTLFLDELNSMTPAMQSKILRVLQEGSFRRIGGTKEIHINVRVISTCNEDPFILMENHTLRSDLFYRLATIVLEVPPLRERLSDIEELVWHHIHTVAFRYAFPFTDIEETVLWNLQHATWPGNIRELFHVVDYALNVSEGTRFLPCHLPEYFFRQNQTPAVSSPVHIDDRERPAADSSGTLRAQLEQLEAEIIENTLRKYNGNITRSATALGLHRQGLQYRIRKYGLYIM